MPANGSNELDWQAFSAAYFPDRRRHDLESLTAYAAYRRTRVNGGRPSDDAREAAALDAWEDEGGPAL